MSKKLNVLKFNIILVGNDCDQTLYFTNDSVYLLCHIQKVIRFPTTRVDTKQKFAESSK